MKHFAKYLTYSRSEILITSPFFSNQFSNATDFIMIMLCAGTVLEACSFQVQSSLTSKAFAKVFPLVFGFPLVQLPSNELYINVHVNKEQ